MLAHERLWRPVPDRTGAAAGWWWRHRHVLAIPLLLALEAAAAAHRPWRRLRLGAGAAGYDDGPGGW